MESFGERIEYLMNTVGYSQLVEKTGISQSQFYRMRSGERDTTRKNLVLISEASKCNIEWLAAGRGPIFADSTNTSDFPTSLVAEPSSVYESDLGLSDDEKELIRLFRSAGLASKSRVLNELIK